ncbi:HAD family hydrolase [Streptomyces longispororuber]|uniref:HAD family hydrolase n=1 Tax=Streptomyces longispororuber TaxID=68230 RepID=UPI00210D04C9|nr:HAD family hydrolase [Streptomyces longispororuber]MCQ4212048.1 HAD hydrolase-like protein [Streptomyces longispororuber]
MAEETRTHRDLAEVVRGARYVLFDFDGPICRLFAGWPADAIARQQQHWLAARGWEGTGSDDPHLMLMHVAAQPGTDDLVRGLERHLTHQEVRAAASAWPTPYADALIRTWHAVGARLAVTTNNSAEAARCYLRGRGLDDCFEPHVYGRTAEALDRIKPDPYLLKCALDAMEAAPADALMIGDAPTDLAAARAVGVPFLGYARNMRKDEALKEAGAPYVVSSLEPVLSVLRERR